MPPSCGVIAWWKTCAVARMGEEQLDDVAAADHPDERRDHRLEWPDAEPLQLEDRERGDARQHRRPEEADARQQVDADRRTEELGEVGGHRDQLSLHPQPEHDAPRELVAAHLREVPAGRDAELRRQRLDQHREQVREHDHPDQPVAELRAGRDVGREVAGIDVRDGRDERRPEERQRSKTRPVERLVDGAEAFRKRRARGDHTRMLAMPKTSRGTGSSGGRADEVQDPADSASVRSGRGRSRRRTRPGS